MGHSKRNLGYLIENTCESMLASLSSMISSSLETGDCASAPFKPDRVLSSASSDVAYFGKTKDFSKYSNKLVSVIDPLNFGSVSFAELEIESFLVLALLSEIGTSAPFGTGSLRAGLARRWNSFCLFKLLPEDGAGTIGVTVTGGTVQIGSDATGDRKGGV